MRTFGNSSDPALNKSLLEVSFQSVNIRYCRRVGEFVPGIRNKIEFVTTRWSQVLQSAGKDPGEAHAALEVLCRDYWYPLYAFVRRKGHNPEDAADLTQAFFAKLLGADFTEGLDRGKGRFRSYLLTGMNHFLINHWQNGQRQKRGGGAAKLSLDSILDGQGETIYAMDHSVVASPDRLFERAWARTLLDRVLMRLERECTDRGDARFAILKPFLTSQDDAPTLAQAAADLNLSLPAFKSLLHRFRQRYRELLLQEVGQTVGSPLEVADELRALLAALRD